MLSSRVQIVTAIVFLAVCSGCQQKEADQTHAPSPLVGEWRSQVQFQSGAYAGIKDLDFMYVFNSGGTMMESSNYDGAPPVPPAYGIWREIADHQFEAKYEFYVTRVPDSTEGTVLSTGWLPAGRGMLVETLTVAADNASVTSHIHLTMFDRAGNPIKGGGTATSKGTKLSF